MSSLYIHIPFCAGKCRYCDFYSCRYNSETADAFIDALIGEWDMLIREGCVQDFTADTVYFGGGTPSVLSLKHWERLGNWINRNFCIAKNAEWSVECNPDSFTSEKAHLWHDIGVTRLTFGIQSLNNRLLNVLGRPHNSETALRVLENQSLSLFKSIGADIMFGLPYQGAESLKDSVTRICNSTFVSHLSAYELSVHEHTPFGRHQSLLKFPDEDQLSDMMDAVIDIASEYGFEQYEVSNFARIGHESRHNTAYWNHVPYAGLGPSAHSFLPGILNKRDWQSIKNSASSMSNHIRYANVADVSKYISNIADGIRPLAFTEECSDESIKTEMLFLCFRTRAGLNEQKFMDVTKEPFNAGNRAVVLKELVDTGYVVSDSSWWKPTARGLKMADAIAGKLI